MGGSAVDAVMAGWNAAKWAPLIGGPLGAIFHQVCFRAGTQVVERFMEQRTDESFFLAEDAVHVRGRGWVHASDVRCGDVVLVSPVPAGAFRPRRPRRLRYVTRNIENVAAGSYVCSRDQNNPNGPLVMSLVERVYRRVSDHLRVLSVRDFNARAQVLETTDDHPFMVPGMGRVDAGQLQVGDLLYPPLGPVCQVIATHREEHPEGIEVFNMRIAGTHTYFVRQKGVDADPVWVHNAGTEYDDDLLENLSLVEDERGGLTTDNIRSMAGVAHGGENLPVVTGQWLADGVGPMPGQIAEQLRGRAFNNFGEFREAFWQLVSEDPVLSSQFKSVSQAEMQAGRGPFAPSEYAMGEGAANVKFNLDHIDPLEDQLSLAERAAVALRSR